MASGESTADSRTLARYACDYCRQKKYRCSKELPKCSACRKWPGPCTYPRHKLPPKPERDIQATASSQPLTEQENTKGIHQRLYVLEKALEALTETVNKALEVINKARTTSDEYAEKPKTATDKGEQTPELFVGNYHSFSFVKYTSATIDTAAQDSSSLHQHAANELQYLSNSLTTAVVDKDNIGSNFFVPSRAEGYQLIGHFLQSASLGDAFFTTPSEELLIQVIFKPETVARRAWVVYVNYIILALVSSQDITKAHQFRHNMQLALNDSSIFLEPHEANLQALILLAIHGEDYASPNLSWMLLGHACRQAEALGLHVSSSSDYETCQRRLSFFWILFAVDKSCSLAFGRPCFLPLSLYAHVPLPNLGYLTKFEPHNCAANSDGKVRTSVFGAHIFLAKMHLAKIMGGILEFLSRGRVDGTGKQLEEQLRDWHTRTSETLKNIQEDEKPHSTPKQLHEMTLGIGTMNFEYLHILMVLLKLDVSSTNSRLNAAREAISLLPSMVSNWTSVYNGIIWHLLYFPFIPFFIIFENLVQGHTSLRATTVQSDLSHLSTTVSYFSSMRAQVHLLAPLGKRLEKIASVFLCLAQLHIDRLGRTETLSQGYTQPPPLFTQNTSPIDKMQTELGDEIGTDLERYLGWLPADILAPQRKAPEEFPDALGNGNSGTHSSPTSDQEPRGLKRPFDVFFDWFAWDVYYADNK